MHGASVSFKLQNRVKWGNKLPGVKSPHPLSYQTRVRSAVNTHPVHAVSSTMHTT